MLHLLKLLYQRAEEIKGKKLAILIAVIFLIFFIIGAGIGYLRYINLKNNETLQNEDVEEVIKLEEFEGKIQYVNPNLYPDDNISYVLLDNSGKEIILLSSVDEKLKVAENLYVKVIGTVEKTSDESKNVLFVERINISNGTN